MKLVYLSFYGNGSLDAEFPGSLPGPLDQNGLSGPGEPEMA